MLEQALPHLPHQVEQAQSSTETGLAHTDDSGAVQGPFPAYVLKQGLQRGKAKKGLRIAVRGTGDFRPLEEVFDEASPLASLLPSGQKELSLFFPLMEKEVLRRCRPQRVDLVAAPSMRCTPAGIVASFGGPVANARFHGQRVESGSEQVIGWLTAISGPDEVKRECDGILCGSVSRSRNQCARVL